MDLIRNLCRDDTEALDLLDEVVRLNNEPGKRTDLFDNVQEVAAPTGNSSAAAALHREPTTVAEAEEYGMAWFSPTSRLIYRRQKDGQWKQSLRCQGYTSSGQCLRVVDSFRGRRDLCRPCVVQADRAEIAPFFSTAYDLPQPQRPNAYLGDVKPMPLPELVLETEDGPVVIPAIPV